MKKNTNNKNNKNSSFSRQVLMRTAAGSLMLLAFANVELVNSFFVPSSWKNVKSKIHHSGVGTSSPLLLVRQKLSNDCSWTSSVSMSSSSSSSSSGEEYASLQVGQVVSVRVGDLQLGRKAWKKRRRSDSPILVPCSILGMNRFSMIVYNIRTLLYKYAEYPKSLQNIHNHQIQLSLSRLKKLYKRDTGSSLLSHANAFGYETVESFLEYLWKEYPEQKDLMPLVLHDNKDEKEGGDDDHHHHRSGYIAVANVSRIKARQMVQKVPMISMTETEEDTTVMKHTGTIRVKPSNNNNPVNNNNNNSGGNKSSSPMFEWKDLSAAVRISQQNVDSERIHMGDMLNAFVFSYDAAGDNGSPLLTLSMDPPNNKRRNSRATQQHYRQKKQQQLQQQLPPSRDLNSLQVGEGPFPATVVRVSSKAGASFVDMGVYRTRGKKQGGGTTRVLGMLRFNDQDDTNDDTTTSNSSKKNNQHDNHAMTVEDLFEVDDDDDDDDDDMEEEIVEDVTDMFTMEQDGSLILKDPETGEITILGSLNDIDDEVDEDDEEDDEDDDEFANLSPEERLEAISQMLSDEDSKATFDNSKQSIKSNRVKEGDMLQVYVKSVFPQSGRFMVTLDETTSTVKAKDARKAKFAQKKKSKLGPLLLQTIMDSVGTECDGTIQAKSKTGNWYYVQPDDGSVGIKFPVGLATPEESLASNDSSFTSGDKVRIRIDGIDESRGQLALTLLNFN